MCSIVPPSVARGSTLLAVSTLVACTNLISSELPAECGTAATPIHLIQGSGARSPLVGETHRVEAVVTARFPGLDGFFLQEEAGDEDQDPNSSEGVFVYEHDTPLDAQVGERIRLSGTVTELQRGGSALTELVSPSELVFCGPGPDIAAVNVELQSGSAIDWEALEGMLVSLDGVITETREWARFGTVGLAHERISQPTQVALPGDAALARGQADDLARVRLDDGSAKISPAPSDRVRGGDRLRVERGVVEHRYGDYRIHPTRPLDFISHDPRPDDPQNIEGDLRVATFNVRNWFDTLNKGTRICGPAGNKSCRGAKTEEAQALQRRKLGAVLEALDADILALQEIENGPPHALANLAADLGDDYRALETGPIGTDVIRVALLFRHSRVGLVGDFSVLDDSVDRNFNQRRNRPVLAQTFESLEGGARFTVAVNHWKSKGSICSGDPDLGDGQARCNGTRSDAARALLRWLAVDPTGSGSPHFLILGDLNSYRLEDPVRVLTDAGYVDLPAQFGGPAGYTSSFDGRFGALDHALASPSLAAKARSALVWHINADEPDGVEADDSVFASSDHDPVLVSFDLDGD